MDTEKTVVYRKEYRMRRVGKEGVETTIPKLVIERAARKVGLPTEDFISQFKVVHLFNNFTDFDAAYRFIRDEKTEEIDSPFGIR